MNKRKAILFDFNNVIPQLFKHFLEEVFPITYVFDEMFHCFDEVLIKFDLNNLTIIRHLPIAKHYFCDVRILTDESVELFGPFHLSWVLKVLYKPQEQSVRFASRHYLSYRREPQRFYLLVHQQLVHRFDAGQKLEIHKPKWMLQYKIRVVLNFFKVLLDDV